MLHRLELDYTILDCNATVSRSRAHMKSFSVVWRPYVQYLKALKTPCFVPTLRTYFVPYSAPDRFSGEVRQVFRRSCLLISRSTISHQTRIRNTVLSRALGAGGAGQQRTAVEADGRAWMAPGGTPLQLRHGQLRYASGARSASARAGGLYVHFDSLKAQPQSSAIFQGTSHGLCTLIRIWSAPNCADDRGWTAAVRTSRNARL
ncbi:hypothetical protein BC834DRAFT_103547 [Gloeopeniophorella convolvens]|nr:hypothetical protein BC834DRAFT_103547 [Gloeopeniophorella convolvens]